jgi:hypothetical protein
VIIGYMSAKAEVSVPKSLVPFHTVVASKADSVMEPATSERATVNTVPLASRVLYIVDAVKPRKHAATPVSKQES